MVTGVLVGLAAPVARVVKRRRRGMPTAATARVDPVVLVGLAGSREMVVSGVTVQSVWVGPAVLAVTVVTTVWAGPVVSVVAVLPRG